MPFSLSLPLASILFGWIGFLVIGLAAGWLAEKLAKREEFTVLGNLVVGCVGSILGGLLLGLIGFVATNIIAKLITATIGAVLLLYLLEIYRKNKSNR